MIKELSLSNTYKEVHSNNVNIISRHLYYMVKNEVDVQEQHEQLPSFYWLPKQETLWFQVHCCATFLLLNILPAIVLV